MSQVWNTHVLPRLVDRACGVGELHKLRARVCAGLVGDVVELGFGSGHNVEHYPPEVTSVAAVEPSDVAWALARPRIGASSVPVVRTGLDGQRLGLPDQSCDAALSTFTLCTIPDLGAALAELRRVLKPGGGVHFLEHGLTPDARVARWQRRLQPLQGRVAGGCHLNRDIASLVAGSGLRIERQESFYGTGPRPYSYLTMGLARA